jgi:hypothetical protein
MSLVVPRGSSWSLKMFSCMPESLEKLALNFAFLIDRNTIISWLQNNFKVKHTVTGLIENVELHDLRN